MTIKQYSGPSGKEDLKNDSHWVTILKNYQLMRNAHFEQDAQNWHIVGTELFNQKFDSRNCKHLRVFIKQPSPSWLDFTLRSVNLYLRKIESVSSQSENQQSSSQSAMGGGGAAAAASSK
eukprot:CAMPEP_0116874682 /NCGR_PEP_ID=MMETSP0463-20121206/6218_1 /TAXON_ID=181622 /ORGANISM="Strombidinopsis sp, Strain SopsisLIS2011" /LENGTH=119 /DNA_ID=CAMNT_0004518719 /DNA_START=214 /DNA_END=573 /DNA_ORIENTATION=+